MEKAKNEKQEWTDKQSLELRECSGSLLPPGDLPASIQWDVYAAFIRAVRPEFLCPTGILSLCCSYQQHKPQHPLEALWEGEQWNNRKTYLYIYSQLRLSAVFVRVMEHFHENKDNVTVSERQHIFRGNNRSQCIWIMTHWEWAVHFVLSSNNFVFFKRLW